MQGSWTYLRHSVCCLPCITASWPPGCWLLNHQQTLAGIEGIYNHTSCYNRIQCSKMQYVVLQSWQYAETENHQFDNFVVTGGTISFQSDNLHGAIINDCYQIDNLLLSVQWVIEDIKFHISRAITTNTLELLSSLEKIINTLRRKQDGRHFPDDIFKCIFFNKNVWILTKISLKFVLRDPIYNIPALVLIMAWRRPGDKPLSEPMMVLSTDACIRHSASMS